MKPVLQSRNLQMPPSFFLTQGQPPLQGRSSDSQDRWSLSFRSSSQEEEKAEIIQDSQVRHRQQVQAVENPLGDRGTAGLSGAATLLQENSPRSSERIDHKAQLLELQRRLTCLIANPSVQETRPEQGEQEMPSTSSMPMASQRLFRQTTVSHGSGRSPAREDLSPMQKPLIEPKPLCFPLQFSSEKSPSMAGSIFETEKPQKESPASRSSSQEEQAPPESSESPRSSASQEEQQSRQSSPSSIQTSSEQSSSSEIPRSSPPSSHQSNCMDEHLQAYLAHVRRPMDPEFEFKKAKQRLIKHKIPAIKYNYSLEDKVQNFQSYKSEISLSKDGSYFYVDLFKPIIDIDSSAVPGKDLNEAGTFSGEGQGSNTTEIKYQTKRSSASCRVDDIQGFTFGPQCSRFWMFRKHINSIPVRDSHKVPFFAWECLTLHMKDRSLDLVIRDEKDMKALLWFLVPTLKTVDGRRNSAVPVIISKTFENKRSARIAPIKRSKTVLGALLRQKQDTEFRIYKRTVQSFKLLAVRNKISYHAQLKGQTIPELFFWTILSTVYYLADRGQINVNRGQDKAFDEIFNPQTRRDYFDQQFMIISHAISTLRIDEHLPAKRLVEEAASSKDESEFKPRFKSINKVFTAFIRKYFEKDEVIEIFRDVPQANSSVDHFEYWNFKRFLNYKVDLKSQNTLLNRIRLFIALGLMKGLLYLKIMIRRIELKKRRLILEVEQGKEVYIDPELSSDRLPASFRFYDFLLRYIAESVAEDRKEFFGMKTGLSMALQKKNRVSLFGDEEEKFVFRVKPEEPERKYEIDFLKSEHTMDVQRSKYVCIDNPLQSQTRQTTDIPKTLKEQRERPPTIGNVKYSLSKSVARSQHEYLKFKSTYATKQGRIKNQGQKMQLVSKTDFWIDNFLLPQIVAQADPPMTPYKQEKLRRALSKIAEQEISKQRNRHDLHIFARIKELFLSDHDSSSKMARIDKLIAYDHKYFHPVSDERQEALNKIQAQHKRVEKKIQKMTTGEEPPKVLPVVSGIQRKKTLQLKSTKLIEKEVVNF